MLTTIILYGRMGRLFGRTWKLDVNTPAEALRAVEANRPGLISYLGTAEENGVRFKVSVGDEQITDPEMVKFAARGKTIRIAPIVQGGKSKVLGLIIGVVLVVAAWGSGMGYFGNAAFNLSQASVLGIKGLTWGGLIGGIGISMAIGGISQMLTKTPKVEKGTKSYNFNGPANVSGQGGPVPLCYGGPIVVGSVRISASIVSEDRAGAGGALSTMAGDYTGDGTFTPADVTQGGGYPDYKDGAMGEGAFSRYPVYPYA